MSISSHPFTSLGKSDQLAIVRELRASEQFQVTFSRDYAPALQFMGGKVAEIEEGPRALMEAMNAKAEEKIEEIDYNKFYKIWKEEVVVLTGIFPIANMAVNGTSSAAFAMGGLTLWSFRSSKLLAAANGCACLALILLSNSLINYAEGIHKISQTIEALNIENKAIFSPSINEHYEGIEKSTTVLRSYFGARKRVLGNPEHQGLQMLREDLSAIQALKSYSMSMLMWYQTKTPLSIESEKLVDVQQIKTFFEKLERVTLKGKNLAAAGTLIGMAYLYCAYLNRAYLMMIAGLTFTLMNGALFSVARSYQMGAIAMREADESNLLEIFHKNMRGRLLPRATDPISLQQAIIIPLDRILRLIPV
ncbi:MAG: hypothetical protein KFB93_06310 [Simkaniaceae bacterium]|nr:MAG: hypothetical protein KFB93_06310 [Simkaniaceae bacterium]